MPSRTLDGPPTVLVNVPLPGLAGFPTVSAGGVVNSAYEIREDAIRRAAARVRALKEFRQAVRDYTPSTERGQRITQVRVTFHVDRDRCSAVVEWVAGGMGAHRVVRRVGGPLGIDSRAVRGLGAGVGLLALMRSLGKVLED